MGDLLQLSHLAADRLEKVEPHDSPVDSFPQRVLIQDLVAIGQTLLVITLPFVEQHQAPEAVQVNRVQPLPCTPAPALTSREECRLFKSTNFGLLHERLPRLLAVGMML